MANLEKVIAALKACENPNGCEGCPYDGECIRIPFAVTRDAIDLLRKQEPVAPTEAADGDMYCGNCGETVGSEEFNCGGISMVKYRYCPYCGRRVLWDDA